MTKRLEASQPRLSFASDDLLSHTRQMSMNMRKLLTHPVLALGSTVIWGLIEFVALNRLRRNER